MKSKIISITAFFAVMVAMTGMAAAGSIGISPDPVNLPVGGSATATITYDDGSGTSNSLTVTWSLLNPDLSAATDIEGTTAQSGPGQTGSYTANNVVSFPITIHDKISNNGGKSYYLQACVQGTPCVLKSYTVVVTAIPEFPAVALPVAGVLSGQRGKVHIKRE